MISKNQNILKCKDDKGWVNNNGKFCQDYTNLGYCKNDEVTPLGEAYTGEDNNFPELNCCNCGKENKMEKDYYVGPSKEHYTCTHVQSQSYSKKIVEYCQVAQNKSACTTIY